MEILLVNIGNFLLVISYLYILIFFIRKYFYLVHNRKLKESKPKYINILYFL